jgi:hypothetical protein
MSRIQARLLLLCAMAALRRCCPAIAGALLAVLLFSQHASATIISGLVDFNLPADMNRFNLASQSTPMDYYASGGVGGSGAVGLRNQGLCPSATLVYNQRSFSMSSPADTLALSVMFHYRAITELSNGGGVGQSPAGLILFADPTPTNQFATGISVDYYVTVLYKKNATASSAFVERSCAMILERMALAEWRCAVEIRFRIANSRKRRALPACGRGPSNEENDVRRRGDRS